VSLILNIETATTVCSVALCENDQVLSSKELNAGYTHAENLHVFIDEVLKKAKVEPSQLNAVAVSKGPGSYTGLRIGSSTAKGLAFALNIPLISIDTLQLMARAAMLKDNTYDHYVPMIDARRMEIYCAVYDKDLERKNEIQAVILTEETAKDFSHYKKPCFFGEGMAKCRELLSDIPASGFIDGVLPLARNMGELSFDKFKKSLFEDVAYFEPFYLKEFMAGLKKRGN
jgi:tRNA threonylcarbamoyladenosine biosynthesis protein TsaB